MSETRFAKQFLLAAAVRQKLDELNDFLLSSSEQAPNFDPGQSLDFGPSWSELRQNSITVLQRLQKAPILDVGFAKERIDTQLASAEAELQVVLQFTTESQGIHHFNHISHIAFQGKNGTNYTLLRHVQNFSRHLDALIINSAAQYIEVRPSPSEIDDLGRRAAQSLVTLERLRAQATDALSDIVSSGERLKSATLYSESEAKRIADQKSRIDSFTESATASLNDISQASARSKEILTQLEQLQIRIESISPRVESFDNFFSERTKIVSEIEKNLKTQSDKYSKQIAEIDRINKAASDMLSGATNAGLAGAFSIREREISKELIKAELSFYASIVVLTVLGIPILAHVIPPTLLEHIGLKAYNAVIDIHSKRPDLEVALSIATRFLILIPGIWLVRTTGRRYDRLFRLREHYAYKYSIATSVEGFQRQSPDHKQELAAYSFAQLSFNPAEKMDGDGKDAAHPNPFVEKFFRFLEGKKSSETEVTPSP
ncbi:hypothetical protein [Alsobacter sp. SYSU BS001988]